MDKVTEVPTIIMFHDEPLIVTAHAYEQFQKRWQFYLPKSLPRDWLKTLGKLLASAVLEPPGSPGRVLRIMKHNFTQTEYWVNPRWRFVIIVDGESRKLATVEWVVAQGAFRSLGRAVR